LEHGYVTALEWKVDGGAKCRDASLRSA
jgi:hypothetical protein